MSNRVNWKDLRKRIPARVQVRPGVFYEVLWAPDLGGDYCGLMLPSKQEIRLQTGHSDKETVHTFFHEIIHLFADEYGVGLTETQVTMAEDMLAYLLKPGNIFTDKK